MALDVGAALRDGLRRTAAPNGLLLIGAFVVVGLASAAADQSLTAGLEGLDGAAGQPVGLPGTGTAGSTARPLALPLPLWAAAGLALLVYVVGVFLRVVAVRTLVSDETGTVPGEYVRRNAVLATVNVVLGDVVVGGLVLVGLVLLVLPGVFLWLSFFFVTQEIAVEDENFVDAMADSWTLASGNRVGLFVLGVVVLFVGLFASTPGLALLAVDPLLGAVVGTGTGAVGTVFGIAAVARAYDQLRQERADRVGALDADDLEPPS